jgi:hypothetical protein
VLCTPIKAILLLIPNGNYIRSSIGIKKMNPLMKSISIP